MPTISFTVSTANASLLREALAHHQSVDVVDVTNADVKEFAGRHLRSLVQKYREVQRNEANPLEQGDPLV